MAQALKQAAHSHRAAVEFRRWPGQRDFGRQAGAGAQCARPAPPPPPPVFFGAAVPCPISIPRRANCWAGARASCQPPNIPLTTVEPVRGPAPLPRQAPHEPRQPRHRHPQLPQRAGGALPPRAVHSVKKWPKVAKMTSFGQKQPFLGQQIGFRHKMTQNDPKMAQNGPKMVQTGPKHLFMVCIC